MTCPCDLQCKEECELCRDTDTIKKGEERKMSDKEEIKELKELLSCCLEDLCYVCAILNPQHKDCNQCDDTDEYREAIK